MSEQKGIIRAQKSKDRPYFSMARATAQDREISFEARGMLAYFLSKPDDWQVMVSDLCQECGKNRVYRIINELREKGYMERIYQRDDKGKITAVDYVVYEVKHPFPQNQEMDNQEMDNPLMDNPLMDNQPLHIIDSTKERENKKEKARSALLWADYRVNTDKPLTSAIVYAYLQAAQPLDWQKSALETTAAKMHHIAPELVRDYVCFNREKGYTPSLKEVANKAVAWYEHRARTKPAPVSTDLPAAALTPIIPDVMDGFIDIPETRYESEF